MNRQTNTRQRILDRANELLTRRGYDGFSYRDISTHLGIKNAAVHYHFPAKIDLALALIESYRDLLHRGTGEFMAQGGDALPQLEGLLHFTESQCERGRCICPFGAFSVSFGTMPDQVQEAVDRFLDESLTWLTRVLEVGRDQGEFKFSGPVRPRALAIFASLQGARQMARIHRGNILATVMDQIRNELGVRT